MAACEACLIRAFTCLWNMKKSIFSHSGLVNEESTKTTSLMHYSIHRCPGKHFPAEQIAVENLMSLSVPTVMDIYMNNTVRTLPPGCFTLTAHDSSKCLVFVQADLFSMPAV